MTIACCDTDIGLLLHGYELKILSENEIEIFETHLLECSYCFEQVKEFAPVGTILATDTAVKSLLEDSKKSRISFGTKLRRIFWPNETPILLKPALLVVFILFLIYPAYQGLFQDNKDAISGLQEITLLSNRSGQQLTFDVAKNKNISLAFKCPDENTSSTYRVELKQADKTIFTNNSFSEVDKFGIGKLFLPYRQLSATSYSLTVEQLLDGQEPGITVEYYFSIQLP